MMLTEFKILRNDRGSVLIIALLVLVLLTIIGISATTTTTTDIQIAGNEKVHSMAFYAADAGIEVGRALLNDLKTADSGNWDNLLVDGGAQLVGQDAGVETLDDMIADNTVGENRASFTLLVRDNDDLDGTLTVDTDNVIFLISTGEYRLTATNVAQVQIETQVRYSGGGDQYAQEHYDTDSSGVAARESGTVADAQRW